MPEKKSDGYSRVAKHLTSLSTQETQILRHLNLTTELTAATVSKVALET